jgi:peptide/nickel transport system substrate-binding protein
MKIDIILVGITISLLLALPATASGNLIGDANEDNKINMQDVTKIERIILEYDDPTDLADANQNGKINMQDVTYIELVILDRIPYGEVVIPVDSEFMKGNILNKGGGPTGSLLYEGLITKNKEGEYDGWLAESWDVSDDARVWTFHLAKDAKWHDGEPFTSADVKFTHNYIKEKELWLSSVLSRVDHVECPDDYTVVFHLTSSHPAFLDDLSHCPGITIIPQHIWEDIDDPDHYEDDEYVGTGPFRFVNKIAGQYFELEANTAYHGDNPHVKRVVLKVITNKDSQVLALKSGEVDVVAELSAAVADSLEGVENIEVYSITDTRGYELGFNVNNHPADVKAFRRAMAHAIDREKICSIAFGGYATPTYTIFLMEGVAHDFVNPDTPVYDYDLDKAESMLKDAGFTDNDEDGILEGPDGNDVTITIPIGGKSASGVDEKIATILKEDWKNIGIEVTIKQVDFSQWFMEIHKNPAFIVGMPYLMHDDADDLGHFGSKSFFGKANWYDYNNPYYDQLVEDIRSTADREERKEIGYAMQDIIADDLPSVSICTTDTIFAYRSSGNGFVGWDEVDPMYWDIVDLKTLLTIKSAAT